MDRDQQLEIVREVLRGQQFAVFAFSGGPGAPPSSAVMFCAETPDLELIFATSPGSLKGRYLKDGNGACAQLDTREVGLERMAEFARVTVQGRLRHLDGTARDDAHAVYTAKIPEAAVFLDRPGVLTCRLEPSLSVFSRGFGERYELEFPPA